MTCSSNSLHLTALLQWSACLQGISSSSYWALSISMVALDVGDSEYWPGGAGTDSASLLACFGCERGEAAMAGRRGEVGWSRRRWCEPVSPPRCKGRLVSKPLHRHDCTGVAAAATPAPPDALVPCVGPVCNACGEQVVLLRCSVVFWKRKIQIWPWVCKQINDPKEE
jgi:hypothetical protein